MKRAMEMNAWEEPAWLSVQLRAEPAMTWHGRGREGWHAPLRRLPMGAKRAGARPPSRPRVCWGTGAI